MSTDTTDPTLPKLPPITSLPYLNSLPSLIQSPAAQTPPVYTLQRPNVSESQSSSTVAPNTGNAELDAQIQAKYAELEKKVANKHAGYTQFEDNQIQLYIQQYHGCKWTEIDTAWQQQVQREIQTQLEAGNTDNKYNIYPRTSAALRSRWRTLKQAEAKRLQPPPEAGAEGAGTPNNVSSDSVVNAANNTNDNKYTVHPPALLHTAVAQNNGNVNIKIIDFRTHQLPDGRIIRKRHRVAQQRDKMSAADQKLFSVIARHYINHKGMLNAVKCAQVCNANTQLAKFRMNNYAASNAWPKYRHWLEKMPAEEIAQWEQNYQAGLAEMNANPQNAADSVKNEAPALPTLLLAPPPQPQQP